MKKFFRKSFLFVVYIAICLGFTSVSYGRTVISIEPTEIASPEVGKQMVISFKITGAEDVVGYELAIKFDPTVLRYVEGANADYLPVGAFVVPPAVTNNRIYLAATSLKGAAITRDGTLATVTFEVLTVKRSVIRLADVTLVDSAGMPLDVMTTDANIMVPQFLTWDVNRDGSINVLDLTLVANKLRTSVRTHERADVNKDNTVNILDLVLIAQHLGETVNPIVSNNNVGHIEAPRLVESSWGNQITYLSINSSSVRAYSKDSFKGENLTYTVDVSDPSIASVNLRPRDDGNFFDVILRSHKKGIVTLNIIATNAAGTAKYSHTVYVYESLTPGIYFFSSQSVEMLRIPVGYSKDVYYGGLKFTNGPDRKIADIISITQGRVEHYVSILGISPGRTTIVFGTKVISIEVYEKTATLLSPVSSAEIPDQNFRVNETKTIDLSPYFEGKEIDYSAGVFCFSTSHGVITGHFYMVISPTYQCFTPQMTGVKSAAIIVINDKPHLQLTALPTPGFLDFTVVAKNTAGEARQTFRIDVDN